MNILIIEDSSPIVAVLVGMLNNTFDSIGIHHKIDVVINMDSWVGLHLTEPKKYDCVLSDWILTGKETAEPIIDEIIDSGICSQEDIAVITGYSYYLRDNDSNDLHGLRAFSKKYLDIPIYEKPYGVDQLNTILVGCPSVLEILNSCQKMGAK